MAVARRLNQIGVLFFDLLQSPWPLVASQLLWRRSKHPTRSRSSQPLWNRSWACVACLRLHGRDKQMSADKCSGRSSTWKRTLSQAPFAVPRSRSPRRTEDCRTYNNEKHVRETKLVLALERVRNQWRKQELAAGRSNHDKQDGNQSKIIVKRWRKTSNPTRLVFMDHSL